MLIDAKFSGIKLTVRSKLLVIELSRPNKRNAITSDMYNEIPQALKYAADSEDIVMVAITGSGDYYSSGNDISSSAKFVNEDEDLSTVVHEACSTVQKFVASFIDFPKVLIAVVNGPAIGIAVTTLALCDVVYASNKATFQTPFTQLGLSAEGCSSYTFPKMMGKSKANKMLLFNYEMGIQEAYDCGLVGQIVPHESLNLVFKNLEELSALPEKSLTITKQLVRSWDIETLHKANNEEVKNLEERWTSDDALQAVVNFLQRRSKL